MSNATEYYVVGDPHLDHAGILKHTGRPGKTVDEMNEEITERWNAKVPNHRNVVVIVCGDLCWHKPEKWIHRLHGKLWLACGNHDKKGLLTDKRSFSRTFQRLECRINGRFCVFDHYPLASWNRSIRGSWHMHGHCHGRLRTPKSMLRIDVGIDCRQNYGLPPWEPWSWDEVVAEMTKREELRAKLLAEGRLYRL